MSSWYELIILWLGVALSLGVIGVCLYKRSFLRYTILNLYLLAIVGFTVGCYYVYSFYGLQSLQYFYFYFTGDAVANIFGYILIGWFFDRLFRDSVFHKYVRPTLIMFFLAVVGVTALFVSRSVDHLYSRFVYEFQQNMYFVGVLLTFLLWISMNYLQAESRRFVLLVSGLGVYFSAHAVSYALKFLFPGFGEVLNVPPLASAFMLSLWLYTFLRVPEGVPAAVPRAVRASLPGRQAGPQEALERL